ncbi:glycine zipper 2TM domain-containing protein [Agarilytica rhodophyticola]|uniref:glycine zipper 2TM domain-containing protein n=1 Tax=Agarilytica rhodophyticola TaxID=1737490 RepID=UPI001C1FC2FE|nr:glycine zipper 2TM domain-containing protein [Agarilytica rhodophyticola]
MNRLIKLTTLASLLSVSAFSAADNHRFYDYAKVKDVTPIYKTYKHRVPEESCWVETVQTEHRRPRHNSATSTIVGGIIGGAIGHAVGHKKSNKRVGAVVGSALGASIGHDIGRRSRGADRYDVSYEDVERCEVSYHTETQERLTGYDVTYKYRGKTYSTFMEEHPGKRIKVSVNVQPVDY